MIHVYHACVATVSLAPSPDPVLTQFFTDRTLAVCTGVLCSAV